jgi:hypothetical protein
MNDIQIMAIRAALKKMTQNGYLCICTIDGILKMTGGIPDGEDYQILRMLHCVNFRDMEPALLRGLPLLIKRVLESEGIDFSFSVGGSMKELRLIDADCVRQVGGEA